MKKLLIVLLLATAAFGQANTREGKVTADSVVISGTGPTATAGLDASAALHTFPFKVGLVAGLPGTCSVGERYFASNATTAGQNSYSCTAPNVWTLDFGAGVIVSSGTVDFSAAGHTILAKKGLLAARPANCTVGEEYFATDATAGQNKSYCTALNTWTNAPTGTVFSVAMSVPAFMGIANSPVTTSGTLALTMNNQNQNLFLAGPCSGAAATPTFRAACAGDLGTGTADSTTYLRGDLTWQPRPITNYLASAYTNATTTFSDVTNMSWAIAANTNYALTCQLGWSASVNTAGPKFQLTGPAAPTAVVLNLNSAVTTSTVIYASVTAFSTPVANTGTVNAPTNLSALVTGGVVNGANAGTLKLQAAANGAGTITLLAGDFCTLHQQ